MTAWTVGRLRAALAGVPDNTPLRVLVAEEPDGDIAVVQEVIGAGIGSVGVSDPRWVRGGDPQGGAFEISCDFPVGANGGQQ